LSALVASLQRPVIAAKSAKNATGKSTKLAALLLKRAIAISSALLRTVYGDVAVIRSGPADSNNYPEKFTKAELIKDLEFYRTEDTCDVFQQREKSRVSKKLGIDLEGVEHISMML
jgi:hypothetical protein